VRPTLLAPAAASLVAALLLVGTAGAASTVERLTAALTSAQEVGAAVRAPGANGRFKASLDGKKLTWSLTFRGLTGSATSAHIHLGRTGVSGPVAVPLCGPCTSGAHGVVTLKASVASALAKGTAYANVHTAKNPAGEIRGQVLGGSIPQPTGTAGTTTTPSTGGGYTPPGGGYDYGGGA